MRYVEFLGIPGSGKTTFAKEVASILRARQNTVFTRWDAKHGIMRAMMQKRTELAWRFISLLTYLAAHPTLDFLWVKTRYSLMLHFIRKHPQLVRQVVEYAGSVDPPPGILQQALSSENLITWFFDIAGIYQASQEFIGNDDVLLIEEGFCQQAYYLVVAFRKETGADQKLKRYIQLIPKPQLVISLFADPDQCEERLQTRPTGIPSTILRSLTVSERITLLEHRLNTYQKIADYLEKQNVTVIRLNNNNSSNFTREIIEEHLMDF